MLIYCFPRVYSSYSPTSSSSSPGYTPTDTSTAAQNGYHVRLLSFWGLLLGSTLRLRWQLSRCCCCCYSWMKYCSCYCNITAIPPERIWSFACYINGEESNISKQRKISIYLAYIAYSISIYFYIRLYLEEVKLVSSSKYCFCIFVNHSSLTPTPAKNIINCWFNRALMGWL